jgi:hypothetical protein
MLKERMNAVETVRRDFLAAEKAQDEATINAFRCIVSALEQRAAANLPVATGVEILDRLSRAAQLSLEARKELVLAHPQLAMIPETLGLVRMAGDVDPCPEWQGSQPLKIVA